VSPYPSPLIPAVQPRPVLPHPFTAVPDGLCGWFVDGPDGRAGHAFPRVVADLDGDWFGRRTGCPAQPRPDEATALAHVVGCDPDDIDFEEHP
jgi:hypothetical protein